VSTRKPSRSPWEQNIGQNRSRIIWRRCPPTESLLRQQKFFRRWCADPLRYWKIQLAVVIDDRSPEEAWPLSRPRRMFLLEDHSVCQGIDWQDAVSTDS